MWGFQLQEEAICEEVLYRKTKVEYREGYYIRYDAGYKSSFADVKIVSETNLKDKKFNKTLKNITLLPITNDQR